jgi:hypothetical protein
MRIVLLAFLLAAPVVSAQVSLDVRAGIAHVDYNGGGFYRDGVARTTPALSVYADVPVRAGLRIRPEVGLTSEGGAIPARSQRVTLEDGTTQTFAIGASEDVVRYLDAAVLVAVEQPVRGVRLGAYVGPAVSVKVREWNVDSDSDGNRYAQEDNLYAPARAAGLLGLTLRHGLFGLDVRHAAGLTEATNPDTIVNLGPMRRSRVTTVALTARIVGW